MGQGYGNYVKPFFPTFFILIGWFLQPFGKEADVAFFLATLLSLGGQFTTPAKQEMPVPGKKRQHA